MEIDPFGFIEDLCHIQKAQESILRKFPFPRKGGVGGEEEEESQEPPDCSTFTESTEIVMVSLPETQDEEAEEEYHTPPENSSAVPSSDEALRRTEAAPGSLSKLRLGMGLSDSCLDLDGVSVPDLGRYSDSGVLDCGYDSNRSSKGKSVLEYFAEKLGNVSENQHSDASGTGLMEDEIEMRETRISNEVDVSGGSRRDFISRRSKSPVKVREDKSTGESNGRLKRKTVDSEFEGALVHNSVKWLKSLKNSGSRGVVKDIANGYSEAVDLDGGRKESPVKRTKILDVNLQVETPNSSVGIVEEKIRELLNPGKLKPLEGMAKGSSERRKSINDSDHEDTIRIIYLEVSETLHGPVVDPDVENAASCGEDFAGNERHKKLTQKKNTEEIEKFRYTAKKFHLHKVGKIKCPGEGSGTINGKMDEFKLCDNFVRKVSQSREGITTAHTDVPGKSSKDAQGLRKLPPSIKGQSTDKDSRKVNQSQDPPLGTDIPPQEDEIIDLAPSTWDAPPPPRVKVPDLMNVMKMITGPRVDTNYGTESLSDIAKRHGMNIPRPRWWPQRDFELG